MDTLLSIISMYNYDTTIFDNFSIPSQLDARVLTDNLMLELGEFEVVYNDPAFLKFAIGVWSKKELNKWVDLYATTMYDYNAIENYNRVDTFKDLETRNLNVGSIETRNLNESNEEVRALTGSENATKNLAGTNLETRTLETSVDGTSTTEDTNVSSGGDTTNNYQQGYNTLAETETERQTSILGSTNAKNVSTTTTQTGTDSGTVGVATTDTGTDNKTMTDSGTVSNAKIDNGTIGNDTADTGTITLDKTGISKGNIGVTTTQQLIQQERELLELNMYDYIIDSFKSRFCVMIY